MDREGTSMSCGEQQMLTIARALMARLRLILLYEPSEGVMPVLEDALFQRFKRLNQAGTIILRVEQNIERAWAPSDRACILDKGRVVHAGTGADLLADREIQGRYCAVQCGAPISPASVGAPASPASSAAKACAGRGRLNRKPW